jgi:hypothetical protein
MHTARINMFLQLGKPYHLLLVSFCLLYSGPSNADMSIKAYQQNIRDSSKLSMTEFYLEAVGTGITWTNSAISTSIDRSLFCTPSKFKLTGKYARRLLDVYLRKNLGTLVTKNDSVSLALLSALAHAHPC